jgi:tetrahydromethanopterin S-methyltransferase subunit D
MSMHGSGDRAPHSTFVGEGSEGFHDTNWIKFKKNNLGTSRIVSLLLILLSFVCITKHNHVYSLM